MNYPRLRIRNKEEIRLLGGHLWAFSNELLDLPKDLPSGSVVTLVRERDGSPIGNGFYNPHSLIAFRLLTRNANESIDEGFFERRIREAYGRRELLSKRRNAYRVVHGESDLLPGLIIDRFETIIAYQIVSAGFEAQKNAIIAIIQHLFAPSAIVEKNNSNLRKLEGLPLGESLVSGTETNVEIHDSAGTRFAADVLAGQKTGFYLDQMENRTRLRDFIRPGERVLDLFSNDGGFGINAALAGARSVLAVDESASALDRLARNADLNGVGDRVQTAEADCFQYLRNSTEEFEVIILDPPALAKSKKDLKMAMKGYLTLNTEALRRLTPGGVLVSCSCSHHMSRDMLIGLVHEAARRADRTAAIEEIRGAGIDHPILAAMPETEYLNALIVRAL